MIVDNDISLMVIHNQTGDMAYLHFAVDFFEDETCHDDQFEPTNPFLRAEGSFYGQIEEDTQERMKFKKGECGDSSAAANPKYMRGGHFNIVYDIWFYIAAEKGYKYHFGVAL